jgi:hypothetical protein
MTKQKKECNKEIVDDKILYRPYVSDMEGNQKREHDDISSGYRTHKKPLFCGCRQG